MKWTLAGVTIHANNPSSNTASALSAASIPTHPGAAAASLDTAAASLDRGNVAETVIAVSALTTGEEPIMDQEILHDLFIEQIRDLYDAEKQLVKALPKLAKAAESEELSDAIRQHMEETQNQVARLEQVFESVEVTAKGKPCKGMKGLLEEGNEAVTEEDKGTLRDLAIIAAAQRVEHYEIAGYGTARTLAEHLGLNDAAELLEQTEEEEKQADTKLTEVATSLYESSDEEEETDVETDEAEMAGAGSSRGRTSSSSKNASRRKR